VIREDDVIASVADALQYISYYHTPDFIRAMGRAYAIEQNPAARAPRSSSCVWTYTGASTI
jgi:fumarate hydratase class I